MSTVEQRGDNHTPGALFGVRVLEVSHRAAAVGGRLLRDLGAEVTKVEPPGGEAGRYRKPTLCLPGGENLSAFWLAFNVGKSSICIDLDTSEGKEEFVDAAANTDIVIVDYERLTATQCDELYSLARQRNPLLIWTEIFPFGRGAPYENYPAGEIVLQALGGHLYLNGDVDRAPVGIGLPVATMHGGAEAASAALMAYFHRLRSKRGQRVDVSLQECITWTLLNSTMTWQLLQIDEQRGGEVRKERANKFYTRIVWPCADGHVVMAPVGGGAGVVRKKSYTALVKWMAEERCDDPLLAKRDWNGKDANSVTQEEYDQVAGLIGKFIQSKTKEELMDRAVRDGILLAPVNGVRDILHNVHLRTRNLYATLRDPERGSEIDYPSTWVNMSATPLLPPSPAPLVPVVEFAGAKQEL